MREREEKRGDRGRTNAGSMGSRMRNIYSTDNECTEMLFYMRDDIRWKIEYSRMRYNGTTY